MEMTKVRSLQWEQIVKDSQTAHGLEHIEITRTQDIYDSSELKDEKTLSEMAKEMIELLPDAMREYAYLGRAIGETYQDSIDEPDMLAAEGKVGRNDPCPCGSGKKYKKCCLH